MKPRGIPLKSFVSVTNSFSFSLGGWEEGTLAKINLHENDAAYVARKPLAVPALLETKFTTNALPKDVTGCGMVMPQ